MIRWHRWQVMLNSRMNLVERGKLTVVLNCESGTLLKLGPELVEAGLREIFGELGCDVVIRNVTGNEVTTALEAARQGDAHAVIVGGGDGTVASAAAILAGQEKPLGILPLGTFNLAARDVGMPMDWKEAARLLVTAPVGEMDLLDVEGKLYLCVVVLGFYPALVMGQPEYHGNWIVKTIRTLMDAFRNAATFPPLNLRLNDGESVSTHRTRMALLANNDYEDIFGILPKRRSLDAGYFTLYILKDLSRAGLVRSIFTWLLGRWKQDREITVLRATELQIDEKRKRRLTVMMDGEVEKMSLPFQVTLRPKALRIIAPRLMEDRPENP